jgi:ElaB/YqjD/DUF883 family membrane-anchored ribosome-binding protein
MFQRRSSAAAIESHLKAIENELGRVGRKAGRHASARASGIGDQIGDVIAPILNEVADRFRGSRRLAADEAARFGSQAVKVGGRIGSEALDRLVTEVEHRPLVTLAVAVGVGILIGIVGRRH